MISKIEDLPPPEEFDKQECHPCDMHGCDNIAEYYYGNPFGGLPVFSCWFCICEYHYNELVEFWKEKDAEPPAKTGGGIDGLTLKHEQEGDDG